MVPVSEVVKPLYKPRTPSRRRMLRPKLVQDGGEEEEVVVVFITCCRVLSTTTGYSVAETPEKSAAPSRKNLDLSSMCQSTSAGRRNSEACWFCCRRVIFFFCFASSSSSSVVTAGSLLLLILLPPLCATPPIFDQTPNPPANPSRPGKTPGKKDGLIFRTLFQTRSNRTGALPTRQDKTPRSLPFAAHTCICPCSAIPSLSLDGCIDVALFSMVPLRELRQMGRKRQIAQENGFHTLSPNPRQKITPTTSCKTNNRPTTRRRRRRSLATRGFSHSKTAENSHKNHNKPANKWARKKKEGSLARRRPTNPGCNNNQLTILNFSSWTTKMKNSPSKQTSTQCREMPLKPDCNCVCRADQASVARQSSCNCDSHDTNSGRRRRRKRRRRIRRMEGKARAGEGKGRASKVRDGQEGRKSDNDGQVK